MSHEFYSAWDSMQIQFDRPSDVHAFLLRVWQILFPAEPWEIDDLSFYLDISEQAQPKSKGSAQPAVDPLATPHPPRRRKRHEVTELRYLYDDPYSEDYYAEP
ncbi:hypothetical protein [Herpetosiphon llansteffanensis]|uniref:hypothetical protein n=1 Tax=Herpetosiphon llansteffanensis TaxID=2094568 RepID=UPI000F519F44|nr:hypothetical protein [Herpetosiphon llansteffanensis]